MGGVGWWGMGMWCGGDWEMGKEIGMTDPLFLNMDRNLLWGLGGVGWGGRCV